MTAPLRRSRPYIFWGQTTSLCETCLRLVPAKIEVRDNEVWYQKRCPQHGAQTTRPSFNLPRATASVRARISEMAQCHFVRIR
jgi:hypothetical protein